MQISSNTALASMKMPTSETQVSQADQKQLEALKMKLALAEKEAQATKENQSTNEAQQLPATAVKV